MLVEFQNLASYAKRSVNAQRAQEYENKYGEKTIVLTIIGERLEAYGRSARIISTIFGREIEELAGVESTYIRKDKSENYYPVLIRKGYRIAILES